MFYVAKWNGNNWQTMSGAGDCKGWGLLDMCTDSENNLYAVGDVRKENCDIIVLKHPSPLFVGLNDEANNDNSFTVFPNPCTDKLNFKNLPNTKTEVLLYDITGKLILSKTLNANGQANEIDVSALSNGLYIAELHAEGKQPKRLKVVKE